MRKKIISFLENNFIKNVIVLISGTGAAQFISIIIAPVITRIYGPASYGLMGTFTAFVSILAPVVALTYPISIVLPKKNEDALAISKLSLLLSIAISGLIGTIIFFFNESLIKLLNLQSIEQYLYLIPFAMLNYGIVQILEQWLIRMNEFKVSAKGTLLQNLIVQSSKVILGFRFPFASILIVLTTFSQAIKSILIFVFLKISVGEFIKAILSSKTKEVAIEYKDFPMFRMPQTLINSISIALPTLMLASFFGPSSVGFYNIGRSVLSIPTLLIGKSVGDVLYPKISSIVNKGSNVTNILWKSTISLSGLGLIPYGIVILFGPELFSFIFGSDWVIAGEYARWTALLSFSSFIMQPVIQSLPVFNAQKIHLLYTIFTLLIKILMLSIGYFVFNNDIIALGLFSIGSAVLNLGLVFLTIYISKKYSERVI